MISPECSQNVLLRFWKTLPVIKNLSFQASSKSKAETGWNGKAIGEVIITKPSDTIILFKERGTFVSTNNESFDFINSFKWSLYHDLQFIRLEHMKRNIAPPVFLFDLAPNGNDSLISMNPHVCKADTYFGQILFTPSSFVLNWKVIGPTKDEKIACIYS